MIISRKCKLLFVHIQKTGGLSLQQILMRQTPDAKIWHGHHSDIRLAEAELGEALADYYTFAFVRNPWDRIVSWYSMVEQTNMGRLSVRDAMVSVPFCRFIRRHIWQRPHPIIAKPQVDYLVGANGQRLVDNIYRFEQYADECRRLCDRTGLDASQIPYKNTSNHQHYSTYYDAETQQIVAARFAADCQAFGYTFDEP